MRSFISEIASYLYDRYGDDVSSLKLVFPSKRARLFFSDALAQIARRPLWQPSFVTVDELMEQVAGVSRSDHIKLLTELYKVYSRHHDETFDAFYFWGDMLLADFDQIDKYLIDADMLFANIDDLHRMEDRFSYLTEEQLALIERFWAHFRQQTAFSQEQQQFIRIWDSLGPIYHEFRDRLAAQGLAYEGMVHRLAAERLRSSEAVDLDTETRYVVIGFNALSACEKRLFTWLQNTGQTEFFWDYDRYYVENPDHEAGLFLRTNIQEYPAPEGVVGSDHFRAPKEVVAVSSPSDSLQCKYVHTFLQNLLDRGLTPNKETAIVLTDESLLLPVLYSLPEGIQAVNVTMGYPLRQTTAYSFVERLIELQARKRQKGEQTRFYHSDVIGLLGHPYLLESHAEEAEEMIAAVRKGQMVYVSMDRFQPSGLIRQIFTPVDGWHSLAVYLREILSQVGTLPLETEDRARRREFFSVMIDRLIQVETSLTDSGVEMTEAVFSSLLRKIFQQERIPYQGEPLAGVQIMGILETRNLDFENVLLLSVNDDTFPGNRAITSSFIPHNLRLAYGLPTPLHHEGVYAYYFYRLLQRARMVHLVYCSRSDERRTGEPSRYIYQLRYEAPHEVELRNIPLSVNLAPTRPLSVPKTDRVWTVLSAFLGGEKTLSPTSLHKYVECPLKFYFHSVAGLKVEEEITEEIDLPMFGTFLHKAMELLYKPLRGVKHPEEAIAALRGSKRVDEVVEQALQETCFREESVTASDYTGHVLLARDIVRRYINRFILPYDASRSGYTIEMLEQDVETLFSFETARGASSVRFWGMSDRIDRLQEGLLQVVDYKTGKPSKPFSDIEALFSPVRADRRPAAFQTLLYAMMISRRTGEDIQPALYYVREMNRPDYNPLLMTKDEPVWRYSAYREDFEKRLTVLLQELFDPERPFVQGEDETTCRYCDFREICRR